MRMHRMSNGEFTLKMTGIQALSIENRGWLSLSRDTTFG
jgi:hypothetical protein